MWLQQNCKRGVFVDMRTFFITIVLFFTGLISASSQNIEVPVYPTFDQYEKEVLEVMDSNTIYVVNYWATWCAPCVKELPYFEEIHSNYKDKNVVVILVTLDFAEHLKRKVIPFINEKKLQSRVLLFDDPKANSWIDKIDPSWSGAIPYTSIYFRGEMRGHEGDFEHYEDLKTFVFDL